jgi:probable DNA metabolism protein
MQTLVYDGSFAGFLSAVFDVYYYKFTQVDICQEKAFNGNIFTEPRRVHTSVYNSQRLWKGLEKKLSDDARKQLYRTFLSELPGIENTLLHYIQYAFASVVLIEEDYSHHAVLNITQTAKKVWREMHRMQALVRFQKTADDLYYAIIEPDYNVLPLLTEHFENRYADQRWMIYDGKRKYGIFYNLKTVAEVQIYFNPNSSEGKNLRSVYDENEALYQQLWQQYFQSINIKARKNTKLHIQHMPVRYWKYLPEKREGSFTS